MTEPVKLTNYRAQAAVADAWAKEEWQKLLDQGFVEESPACWSSETATAESSQRWRPEMQYRPHIKRIFHSDIGDWLWGCYMSRSGRHPVIICRDLRELMGAAKRKFGPLNERKKK